MWSGDDDDTEFRSMFRGRGECDISWRDRVCRSVSENQHEQRTSQVAGGRWLETGQQVTCVQMTYVCHCVSLRQGYISLIISVSRSL